MHLSTDWSQAPGGATEINIVDNSVPLHIGPGPLRFVWPEAVSKDTDSVMITVEQRGTPNHLVWRTLAEAAPGVVTSPVLLHDFAAYGWTASWLTHEGQSYRRSGGFETGPRSKAAWQPAQWLACDGVSGEFHGSIQLEKSVAAARVYIACAGECLATINGVSLSEGVPFPARSRTSVRLFANAFDVGELLSAGTNDVILRVAQGWHGMTTGQPPEAWKRRPMVAAVFALHDGPGNVRFYYTGSDWRARRSPVVGVKSNDWNNAGGEIFDARVLSLGQTLHPASTKANMGAIPIVPQKCPRRYVASTLPAERIVFSTDCVRIVDIGKIVVGKIVLTIKNNFYDSLTLRYAEAINSDGRLNEASTYGQTDRFIGSGLPVSAWSPWFARHAFRYVEITAEVSESGKTVPVVFPSLDLRVEVEYDNCPVSGTVDTPDPYLASLYKTTFRTLDLLMQAGVPVDCPHREQLGYGDSWVGASSCLAGRSAEYLYLKWLDDWVAEQDPDSGELPYTAPYHYPSGGGPAWGSALVFVADDVYRSTGQRYILERYVNPAMKWVGFLMQHVQDGLLAPYFRRAEVPEWEFLGDWVPPRYDMSGYNWQTDFATQTRTTEDRTGLTETPVGPGREANHLFNSCVLVDVLQRLVSWLTVLGRRSEAKIRMDQAEQIAAAINARWLAKSPRRYGNGEQTYQVYPLILGIVPKSARAEVEAVLIRDIERRGYHLDTGHIGTRLLLQYLVRAGLDSVAYRIVTASGFPGWRYMLENGATSLWEQWSGWMSQLHSCFTSVGWWFYESIGGIRQGENSAGYTNITVEPFVPDNVSSFSVSLRAPLGEISLVWCQSPNRIEIELRIPPGVQVHAGRIRTLTGIHGISRPYGLGVHSISVVV